MTNPPRGGEQPPAPSWAEPQRQYRRPPVPPPSPRPHVGPSESGGPQYARPEYAPPRYARPPYAAPPAGPPQHAPYGQPWAAPQAPQQYAPPGYGLAPYGQDPYAPGGAATPTRRRRGLIWVLAGGVVVVAAIAVVLSLVLGTRVLDRAAVQRDVAVQFRQHEGVAIRLRCDDSMELTTGAIYRCTGTTADGEHVTLQIRVTDAKNARYTWSEQR